VLEIGTGTGYNAALLAHRLGAANVVTVEVDAQVATRARATLDAAGFAGVEAITAAGELGHAPRAPYDRIVSTACVRVVPHAWVRQTRAGGRILTPWSDGYIDGGLLSLTVGEDGTATGRIVDPCSFMWLRGQRPPASELIRDGDHATTGTTTLHPHQVAADFDAQLTIGRRVPRCRKIYEPYDEARGAGILWLLDPWSGSWASHRHTRPDARDDAFTVHQHGPRSLWNEVEAAHGWWLATGRPAAADWHFAVGPRGSSVTLDGEAPR